MKVFIDTNILISAALSSSGTPFQAYFKAVTYPNHGIVCEQNIDEMRRIFNRKFPSRIQSFERFLSLALLTLEVVPTPDVEEVSEQQIRDVKDRPLLRAALAAGADVILTGDKDFLEADIERPVAMTPADFIALQTA